MPILDTLFFAPPFFIQNPCYIVANNILLLCRRKPPIYKGHDQAKGGPARNLKTRTENARYKQDYQAKPAKDG